MKYKEVLKIIPDEWERDSEWWNSRNERRKYESSK